MSGQRTPDRQRHLDTEARKAGFKDYETMAAYYRNQEAPARGTVAVGTAGKVAPPPQTGGAANNAMSWHPRVLFNRISKILQDTNGK
jgi:hypothetical protein